VTSLESDEAERLSQRLADLVWAGLRGLPGSPNPGQDER
jgi:hypothetical protein